MSGTVSIYKHPKSDNIYLDINFNGVRKRQSTKLKKTATNLKLVEKEIIPKIQVAMANGTFSFEDKKDISSNIFGKFAESYFELIKNNVRTPTYKGYLVHYNNHIKPYFEKKIISNIKPIDIEKWQNELIKKGYAQNTLGRYKSIFYSIMEKAYKNDLITNNPFEKTNQPKQKKATIENILEGDDKISPFTEDELKIMFTFDGYIGHYIYFAVHTGMRPSEILALNWSDIDFENKRIAVFKSILDGQMDKTKTRSSTRYVDLLPNLEERLKQWKKECNSKTILFPNRFGKRFYGHSGVNKTFKDKLKKNNIKYRYIYQLRHTFASRYISRLSDGVNILWVSKMLGHKDISVTLNTYTKFIKEDKEKRLENLEKMAHIWHT